MSFKTLALASLIAVASLLGLAGTASAQYRYGYTPGGSYYSGSSYCYPSYSSYYPSYYAATYAPTYTPPAYQQPSYYPQSYQGGSTQDGTIERLIKDMLFRQQLKTLLGNTDALLGEALMHPASLRSALQQPAPAPELTPEEWAKLKALLQK